MPRFAEMPGYIPLTKGRAAHPDQPAVIALPMPKPYGIRNMTKKAIDGCAPATVAAFIEWLLARKWRVSDREDPAYARDGPQRHLHSVSAASPTTAST